MAATLEKQTKLGRHGCCLCVETGLGQVAKLLGARAELRMSCAFRTGKSGKDVCGNVMSGLVSK